MFADANVAQALNFAGVFLNKTYCLWWLMSCPRADGLHIKLLVIDVHKLLLYLQMEMIIHLTAGERRTPVLIYVFVLLEETTINTFQ